MTEYKGRWEAIRGPLVVLSIMLTLLIFVLFFVPQGFWFYFFMIMLLLFMPLAYSGLILKIMINDKKIVVIRPFTRVTVKFENVALCAVHNIEEGSSLIYAFVKSRSLKGYTVKGIRPKLSFDEIVRMTSKNEDVDLDINFSRAKKIPVSFVDGGEELKERFLLEVGKYHVKIMD